ncbi:MAG: ferritin [Kutzneria sp.]|nr:ferritin [Kutzneria sp.]
MASNSATKFQELLQSQIRNELTAAQQYLAIAVWFDGQDLPQLARHFYRQSLEERNHAMMIVQYLLDNDIHVAIPGVGEVRNEFAAVREPVALAVEQERSVTEEIVALARAARDEGDYVGEQFLQWFLKEQVEEISSMTTLLHTVDRAKDNVFHIEDFLAREVASAQNVDPTSPAVAGGRI